jgi:Ca-activated chloride channel family protein
MTSRLLISLSVLLIAAPRLCAQLAPAEDFFNSGAQLYISNNIPLAKEQVEMGLKLYPDDEKLKKLEELLKQQQQQNQQQQNQQNQQKQDQQQSQQQKSDSQKNQQQKESQDQQKRDEQKQAEQKKTDEEKKAEQQKADAEKKDEQKGEGQPLAAGQMTPEEAKRLLDAQKGNEQFLQLKPQDKPQDSRRLVKDW